MSDFLSYLFWEKQEGYLCAQHCLNALLQGEYFTAVDLSEIARELDEAESAALNNTDEGSEAKTSQNMDDTGFFSIQDLDIILYGSEDCVDARIRPEFTLRKFGNSPLRWYNLDSVLKGPEWISQLYLELLLAELNNNGYSVFVVKGIFPRCQADDYVTSLEANGNEKSADTDEEMLQAAIAASLSSLGETNDRQQESPSSSQAEIDSRPTTTSSPSTRRLTRFS
ncbi:768_t:CDS:2 [Paraglomus occultum]|uniref:Ataxin-3 homolog n=1 Tax=Paraglomus occultum TaxID=144539 RepID=A0A9N9FT87_9GLOM|nr:768_t:CDS:2 [Paraglomus occultum]